MDHALVQRALTYTLSRPILAQVIWAMQFQSFRSPSPRPQRFIVLRSVSTLGTEGLEYRQDTSATLGPLPHTGILIAH